MRKPTPYRQIADRIRKVLSQRAIGRTMCPSEALPPSQRTIKSRMEAVRAVAERMARTGQIEITQRGRVRNQGPWVGPIRLRLPRSAVPFDYAGIDFRREPEKYRVARGEQGVLSVEPYKSELLPLWKFKNAEVARVSARAIRARFDAYRQTQDFVGMDMARKFLQMGFTRSRRYANHRSGRKFAGPVPKAMKGRSGAHGRKLAAREPDAEKARAAEIFYRAWQEVEAIPDYRAAKAKWRKALG